MLFSSFFSFVSFLSISTKFKFICTMQTMCNNNLKFSGSTQTNFCYTVKIKININLLQSDLSGTDSGQVIWVRYVRVRFDLTNFRFYFMDIDFFYCQFFFLNKIVYFPCIWKPKLIVKSLKKKRNDGPIHACMILNDEICGTE